MKLSQTSEMAIHGLWELALAGDDRLLVSEIAKRHNVSGSYLSKVFHRLGKAGIVISRRGKVGGFTLARPADEITIGEIIRVFETDFGDTSLGEYADKSNKRMLVLNGVMKDVDDQVFQVLDNVSLADLKSTCKESESPKLRRRKYIRREGNA